MQKYRVWLRDMTLQSIVVEAESAKQARENATQCLTEGIFDFEDGHKEETCWEVESIENITA